MAAVTDEVRRQYIADNVSSDLQYVLDEAGISLANQYAITLHYSELESSDPLLIRKLTCGRL